MPMGPASGPDNARAAAPALLLVAAACSGAQSAPKAAVSSTSAVEPSTAPPTQTAAPLPDVTATTIPCIPSGDQDDINSALVGVGAVAVLCPQAVFKLTSPVEFTAPGQQLYTSGSPTDDSRALLHVAHPDLVTAVQGNHDRIRLAHVIVDIDVHVRSLFTPVVTSGPGAGRTEARSAYPTQSTSGGMQSSVPSSQLRTRQ